MIIGLVGFIGCGKNTVAEEFKYRGFKQDSFAAPLKDACASMFGWDREMLEGNGDNRAVREEEDKWWAENMPTDSIDKFSPRRIMQIMGTEVLRHKFNPDIWLKSLHNRWNKAGNPNTVVSDCRFQNEVKYIRDMGGAIIRVKRGPDPDWYPLAVKRDMDAVLAKGVHIGEADWILPDYDYVIENDGSLCQLAKGTNLVIDHLTTGGDW